MTKNEEIDMLQHELAKAMADTVRLDWLADPNNHIGTVALPEKCVYDHLDSLRDAIDAAMALPQDTPSGFSFWRNHELPSNAATHGGRF